MFPFVDAINPQADVLIGGGVKIGYVSEINTAVNQVQLTVILNKNVKIPKNAKFKIFSKGIMGDKYINVVAQEDTGEYIQPNERIAGVEPSNIDRAFERLSQVADSLKFILGDPEVKESFGDVLKNFSKVSKQLNEILATNENNLNRSLNDIAQASRSLKNFSEKIELISSDLQKGLSPENGKNLSASLANLRQVTNQLAAFTNQIDQGKGTLGVLIKDPEVAKDLKDLVEDLRQRPWRLLWKN
jgi:phospholipid/cholesterol/gamma-HCH transport system substrate-binding protein